MFRLPEMIAPTCPACGKEIRVCYDPAMAFSEEVRELVRSLRKRDESERKADQEFLERWGEVRKRVSQLMADATRAIKEEWNVTANHGAKNGAESMHISIDSRRDLQFTLTFEPRVSEREVACRGNQTASRLLQGADPEKFTLEKLSDVAIQQKIKAFIGAVFDYVTNSRHQDPRH